VRECRVRDMESIKGRLCEFIYTIVVWKCRCVEVPFVWREIYAGHGVMLSLMSTRVNMVYHPDKSIQTITLLKYLAIPVARELCKSINSDEADGVMRRLRRWFF
jgi:hypothetical protein